MPTYLQAVEIPKRCFLFEALLWATFQRLPIAWYNMDGCEAREVDDDIPADIGHPEITDEECRFAGIPRDPAYVALLDDTYTPDPEFFDDMLMKIDMDENDRADVLRKRETAVKFRESYLEWRQQYDRVVEYPASQIFVALKSGKLRASGIRAQLDSDASGPLTDIPPAFWSLKGISFETNEAQNGTERYRHVVLVTEEILKLFPGDRMPVSGVQRVGDCFVIDETQVSLTPRGRGRPAYPWERFHVEVAVLLRDEKLPQKKEAAIQYFQSWFERELRVSPSRAAIGERLKPYYDLCIKSDGSRSRVVG